MHSAVITCADHPTGLITARSLKDESVRLIGVTRHAGGACLRSRLWNATHEISYDDQPFCDELIRIAQQQDTMPVLFPSDDESVLLASKHRERLQEYYRFVYPSHERVQLMMDKLATYVWARERGFPVIPFQIVDSLDQIADAVCNVGLPVIIKPPVRLANWDRILPQHKALRIDSPEQLPAFMPALRAANSRLVVQRWIDGGDSDIHFVLSCHSRDGELLGSFTGRKILQWPIGIGSTAACRMEENPETRAIAHRYFREAGFRGLGSIEFKFSAADNKYYLIEPTIGRNNLQSYVAVASGMNLTRTAFYDALNATEFEKPTTVSSVGQSAGALIGARTATLDAAADISEGQALSARKGGFSAEKTALLPLDPPSCRPLRNVTWIEEQKLARALLWLARNESWKSAWRAYCALGRPRAGCYFFRADYGPGRQLLRGLVRKLALRVRGKDETAPK